MGVLVLPVQDFGRLCKVTGPYNNQYDCDCFCFLMPFFLKFTFLSFSPTNACYWIYCYFIIKGIDTDIDVWPNWKILTEAILVSKKDDAATDEIMTTTQTITAGGGKNQAVGIFCTQSW